MTEASFGHWVRTRRTELLLTQEELAERAGLSVRTVRNLEAGRGGAPRLETRRLLLAALSPAEPVADGSAVRPAQLPLGVAGFTGREEELRRLDLLLDEHRAGSPAPVVISAISGMAGVGKTAVAVHWGHRVRDWFVDGQLYVDLRGFAPGVEPLRPIDALARFLQALGVPNERVPLDVDAAAAMYRTLLADRRMLILLDNARDAAQVRPLLPAGGGNLVVVTSRDRMDGLLAREGARRFVLTALTPDEALAALVRILGQPRVAAEPEAAAELVRLCARLPLALRIVGANLHGQPELSIAGYVSTLRTGLLDELAVDGDAESAVRVAFDLSYLALPAEARRLFRRLGLVPVPDLTAETAGVIADLDAGQAAGLLDLLARTHLLEQRTPGRFSCHDLLRRYALERAEVEEEKPCRAATVDRLYRHYLDRVDAVASALYPQLVRVPAATTAARGFADGDAVAWMDAERANLVAAVVHAAEYGQRPAAWRLADGMRGYFIHRVPAIDWLSCAQAALTAAEADGDHCGQTAAQLSLAALRSRLGDQQRAIEGYRQARLLAREAGWRDGEVAALGSQGNVYMRLGRPDEAAVNFTEVLAHARRTGRLTTQASVLSNLGLISLATGRLTGAVEQYAESLALARQSNATGVEANSLANLGEAYHALGQFDRAVDHLTQALALHRTIGDRDSEAHTLCLLAATDRDRGDHTAALHRAEEAVGLMRDTAHRHYQTDAYDVLGTIHCRMGRLGLAVEYHRKAVELARASDYRSGLAIALLGQADAHRRQGEPDAAGALLCEAQEIASSAGYRVAEGRARVQYAALRLEAGQPATAVDAASAGVAIHRETGHRFGQALGHGVLAAALEHTCRPGDALLHRRAAQALLAALGVPEMEVANLLGVAVPTVSR